MDISPQGLQLLMGREGKRNDVYLDSVGVPTVGYGHTGPDVHMGDTWTDVQIEEAFAKDLERFEKALNAALTVPVAQNQYDALVSWLYNVGPDWAHKATLVKKINAGDLEGAARAFDDWHIPPEITSRRNGEREQFKGTAFEPRIS